MELKLVRDSKYSSNTTTIGRLYVDGAFESWALEDAVREVEGEPVASWKIKEETAIPRGKYIVIIDFSNRFQKDMPHVLNVPGFDGVRIHSGNTAHDTEGCILIGDFVASHPDWLSNSRIKMARLMQKMEEAYDRGEEITLEVV